MYPAVHTLDDGGGALGGSTLGGTLAGGTLGGGALGGGTLGGTLAGGTLAGGTLDDGGGGTLGGSTLGGSTLGGGALGGGTLGGGGGALGGGTLGGGGGGPVCVQCHNGTSTKEQSWGLRGSLFGNSSTKLDRAMSKPGSAFLSTPSMYTDFSPVTRKHLSQLVRVMLDIAIIRDIL